MSGAVGVVVRGDVRWFVLQVPSTVVASCSSTLHSRLGEKGRKFEEICGETSGLSLFKRHKLVLTWQRLDGRQTWREWRMNSEPFVQAESESKLLHQCT